MPPRSFDMLYCLIWFLYVFGPYLFFLLWLSHFLLVCFLISIFVGLLTSFLQLISNLKFVWSKNMFGKISISLNLLKLVWDPNTWSILENVPYALGEKMYNLMFWNERLYKCQLCLFDLMCHLRLIFLCWFSV